MRIGLIHGNDGSDVRVSKVCRSLNQLGHSVTLIGWDRAPAIKKPIDLGDTRVELLRFSVPYSRATTEGIIRFAGHIRQVLSRTRPLAVHCENEDNAILTLPFKHLYYRHLVCDVFDALTDRYSGVNTLTRLLLRTAGNCAREASDHLIVTDQARAERLGKYSRKATIIMNVPEDPGPELASNLPDGPIKILVSGGIACSRGIKPIVMVATRLEKVRIVAVGWLYDEFASGVFAKHPAVSYRGVVTPNHSLRIAGACDAILAFYALTRVDALYASPNKVYDAMCIGRPVIIKKEALVARWALENGVGFACPYDDVDALQSLVASLREHRKSLKEFARHTREIFLRDYTWERMTSKLGKIYDSLRGRNEPNPRIAFVRPSGPGRSRDAAGRLHFMAGSSERTQ